MSLFIVYKSIRKYILFIFIFNFFSFMYFTSKSHKFLYNHCQQHNTTITQTCIQHIKTTKESFDIVCIVYSILFFIILICELIICFS